MRIALPMERSTIYMETLPLILIAITSISNYYYSSITRI